MTSSASSIYRSSHSSSTEVTAKIMDSKFSKDPSLDELVLYPTPKNLQSRDRGPEPYSFQEMNRRNVDTRQQNMKCGQIVTSAC